MNQGAKYLHGHVIPGDGYKLELVNQAGQECKTAQCCRSLNSCTYWTGIGILQFVWIRAVTPGNMRKHSAAPCPGGNSSRKMKNNAMVILDGRIKYMNSTVHSYEHKF